MIVMYGTIFISYIFAAITLVFKIIDTFIEANSPEKKEEVEEV